MAVVALGVGSMATVMLAACGGSDESSGTAPTEASIPASNALPPDAPTYKVLAKQFPKPVPTEGAPKNAAKYIARHP